MMKFRKKPIEVDAEQFSSSTGHFGGQMFMQWPIQKDEKGLFLIIPTLEGSHRANEGDWIITGIKGEHYPCKPYIFEQTYEKVD